MSFICNHSCSPIIRKGNKRDTVTVPARRIVADEVAEGPEEKASQVILCKRESRYHSDALIIAGKGRTRGSLHVQKADAQPRFHFCISSDGKCCAHKRIALWTTPRG
jgi:thioredoxin reductase